MTAKEFLERAFKLYRKLDCNLEQLQRLQDLSKKISSVISGTPTVSNKNFSRVEAAVTEFQAQSELLTDDIAEYSRVRIEIAGTIAQIPNETERLILDYRYLSFKSWRYIAAILNITARRVYQLHDNALISVEKILQAADEFH